MTCVHETTCIQPRKHERGRVPGSGMPGHSSCSFSRYLAKSQLVGLATVAAAWIPIHRPFGPGMGSSHDLYSIVLISAVIADAKGCLTVSTCAASKSAVLMPSWFFGLGFMAMPGGEGATSSSSLISARDEPTEEMEVFSTTSSTSMDSPSASFTSAMIFSSPATEA